MQKTLKRIITVILLLCVALSFACFAACDFTQSPETPTNPSQQEQTENNDSSNSDNSQNNGATEHTCSFVIEKAEEKYLKSAATCKSKAVYYKSCSCGKASETETFESGTFATHKYVDKVCEYCSKKQLASEGLAFTLNEEGTEYSATGIGTCTDTDLVIPETYNDLPVTGIGLSALSFCSLLKSVTIPNSVTSIRNGAFYGCSSLTSIEIPNSVTSIGYSAFEECSLENVTFENPTDWYVCEDSTATSGTKLTLTDAVLSAMYLTWDYYCSYYWKRG